MITIIFPGIKIFVIRSNKLNIVNIVRRIDKTPLGGERSEMEFCHTAKQNFFKQKIDVFRISLLLVRIIVSLKFTTC